ncbi:unnamed protein product [Linum tenue]|uniref:Zinc finger PHD-type domain-containing protein n=1 Tax=Linum tenue TaxID=586396 RepID=A0AAV0P945_9ROSI|nr:unnamed protein product [Linum tenue]
MAGTGRGGVPIGNKKPEAAAAAADEKDLRSYTIRLLPRLTVKVGDSVQMKFGAAKIERLFQTSKGVYINARFYIRSRDTRLAILPFISKRELFLAEATEIRCVTSIESKVTVHSAEEYFEFQNAAGEEDYFWRFYYHRPSGRIAHPGPGGAMPVICICEMPWNPDNPMMECIDCGELFHPPCVGMTRDEAAENAANGIDYVCSECNSQGAAGLPNQWQREVVTKNEATKLFR